MAKWFASFPISGLITPANRGSGEFPGGPPCSFSNICGLPTRSRNGPDTGNPRRSPTSRPPLSRRTTKAAGPGDKGLEVAASHGCGKSNVGLNQPGLEIFFRALLPEKTGGVRHNVLSAAQNLAGNLEVIVGKIGK